MAQSNLAVLQGTTIVRNIGKTNSSNVPNTASVLPFSIAPNPANQQASVLLPKPAQKLSIYSLSGTLVFEEKINDKQQQQITVTLDNLHKGIYLVKVIYADQSNQTEKLVVMH